MKMRWALLVLTLFSATAALADNLTRVPAPENLEYVAVHAAPDWDLHIAQDGSGTIGFGTAHEAKFPSQTFDFGQVCRALAAIVPTRGLDSKSYTVGLMTRGDGTYLNYYSNKSDVLLPWFDLAKKHLRQAGRKDIDEQWVQHPPKMP